jgi:nucleotide-binding universal stress UspA family protein
MFNPPVTPELNSDADSHPLQLLIPVDATDSTRRAIDYAIRRTKAGAAVEVSLLYVIEPVNSWELLKFRTRQEILDHFRQRAEIFLDDAAKALTAAGIASQRHCREDETVRGILAFAEEHACAEIVVPQTTSFGMFSCGLAAKLTAKSQGIPVVQIREDGSPLH